MSRKKAFIRDRDAMLRSLDEGAFDRFYRKWNVRRPHTWQLGAKLIAMHKGRLHVLGFSEEEKAVSRHWLADNGYDEEMHTTRPCPECGGTGPSFSSCSTCGMAQA